MSNQGKLQEAFGLSEMLLAELELDTNSLSRIALKAGRLARLMGQFDLERIMQYESSGYPEQAGGIAADVWTLAKLAGRVYEKKFGDELKSYANIQSIEQLELQIAAARDSIAAAADPSISITSANPNQMVWPPAGNNQERTKLRAQIADSAKTLSQRRAFIYGFVSRAYEELKFSGVANDIFERTRTRVDATIGEVIPDAVKRFSAVYENLRSENDEDWSNAVHSCRRILQDTADALFPAREDKVTNPGGKEKVIRLGPDNYINRLIAYVEEKSSSDRFNEIVGSHMKYLGERLDSIFLAAQKGSHAVIASQDEADRYVIYTYLVVGDILKLHAESGQS